MKALIVSLALAAGSAQAFTGNELYRMMQDPESGAKLASLSYVRGFVDATLVARLVYGVRAKNKEDPAFCVPNESDVSQALDVVRSYLAANPAVRHLDAGVLSAYALAATWPCK